MEMEGEQGSRGEGTVMGAHSRLLGCVVRPGRRCGGRRRRWEAEEQCPRLRRLGGQGASPTRGLKLDAPDLTVLSPILPLITPKRNL